MFTQRSKDAKIMYVISYHYQEHKYNVHKYRDGDFVMTFKHNELSFLLNYVVTELKIYDSDNPTKQRYHKLSSGDIYDNETETVINHNALIGLLGGLESDDNDVIRDAIYDLTQ